MIDYKIVKLKKTSLKHILIQALSRLGCILLHMKGVNTGKGVILSNFPIIRKCHGSNISIGNRVTLHSMRRMNPVLTCRTCIATISEKAKIILSDGCGVSGTTMIAVNSIFIGKDTLIGADSLIIDNDMHYPLSGSKWGNTWGQREQGKPIHIGAGCFIGARSIILKGVIIGDGAVVAAGAVVARDVPSGCLAAGNPAVNRPLPERLKHPEPS